MSDKSNTTVDKKGQIVDNNALLLEQLTRLTEQMELNNKLIKQQEADTTMCLRRVADRLHVHNSVVKELVDSGALPAFVQGERMRVTDLAFKEFLQKVSDPNYPANFPPKVREEIIERELFLNICANKYKS